MKYYYCMAEEKVYTSKQLHKLYLELKKDEPSGFMMDTFERFLENCKAENNGELVEITR